MRRILPLIIFVLLLPALSAGQTDSRWTLERAVEYALDSNLQVRQLTNVAETNRLRVEQAKKAAYPTLNAGTNGGLQFGRTIDPTTNTFDQQTIGFQSINLQANALLYNGGQIRNTRRQAEVNFAAAQLDARVTRNNVSLQVANSFLNVVLLREQLANARAQLQLSEEQLSNTNRLIEAGAVPPAQRFDLEAQRATNRRSIVELENQVELAKLSLQLLLELDPDDDFTVVTPEIELGEEELMIEYRLPEVMTSARGLQPTILAAQLRAESAAVGEDLAKAGMRPTVSVFGNLSTNYSSVARDFSNPDASNVELVQGPDIPVVINGMPGTIANFQQSGLVFPNQTYFDQLDQNFGQAVGVSLNVPIYSQGRNKINVQQARLQRMNAALDVEQAENQLRNDVQLALANLRAAQQSYRAAQISLEAGEAAYDNTQRLFRAGNANSLDLVTAANRLEQARTELTRTKFQLIFNRQVIRFYLGQGFSFE